MTRMFKLTLASVLTLAGVGAFVIANGCDHAAEASSTGASTTTVADGTDKAAPKGYKIEVKPVGTYKVGEKGAIEIVVTADEKSEWHVNHEYPTKFKAPDAKGDVDFAQAKLESTKDAAAFKLDPCKKGDLKCVLHVTVPVTPTKKGKVKVTGTLFFGVCDPKVCLNPKEDISFEIDVK